MPAVFGQFDPNLALIAGVALALHKAHDLEFLEDRREGVGLEKQPFAQAADRDIVLLPQRDDRDVLRVGQPKSLEDGFVGLAEGQVRRIDRKTQEVGELRGAGGRFFGGFHGHPHWPD
ncbi:hypothetical protein D3C75_1112600 [compost metagenome]